MIQVRKSNERGHANHGWLNAKHTFSFANYYDPKFMGFGPLRVINEDRIQAGQGFGTHPHQNMEILTYVIEGSLMHKDSMGNTSVIRPGEVQRMSAGTGVLHSEHSDPKEPTHLLQIWIIPEKDGIEPSYDQKNFAGAFACSDLTLVASRSSKENSLQIHQDVDLYVGKAQADGEKTIPSYPQRNLWVQVVKGDVTVNGTALSDGDGAGLRKEEALKLQWKKGSEFLVFDMGA